MILQVGGLKRTILFPPKKIALLFTHGFNQHHSLKTLETVVGRLGLMNHHQQPEKLVRCWNHPGCHSKTSSKWENDRRATPILKNRSHESPIITDGWYVFFCNPYELFFSNINPWVKCGKMMNFIWNIYLDPLKGCLMDGKGCHEAIP